MKKFILILLLATATVLLSSCGNFDVTCSIDRFNNAEMRIDFQIKEEGLSEYDISSIDYDLYDLGKYWENSLGYDIYYNYNPDCLYDITLCKSVKCDSKEEAVNELLEMMGADYSPFSSVEGGYSTSYLNDYFSITAEVDLSKIIADDYMAEISQDDREYIEDKLNTFSGTVNFDFYGDTVKYEGSLTENITTAELSLDSITKISSSVKIADLKNKQDYNQLKDEIAELEKQKKQFTLFVILAGSLLLAIVALATVLMILRKKRKNEKPEAETTPLPESDKPAENEKEQ